MVLANVLWALAHARIRGWGRGRASSCCTADAQMLGSAGNMQQADLKGNLIQQRVKCMGSWYANNMSQGSVGAHATTGPQVFSPTLFKSITQFWGGEVHSEYGQRIDSHLELNGMCNALQGELETAPSIGHCVSSI